MSKVPQFKRHERDTGSPEYQVSVLSARIAQLSTHMISNRKDYSSRRGLEALLGRRRHFMQYLYRTDRWANNPGALWGFPLWIAGTSTCQRRERQLYLQAVLLQLTRQLLTVMTDLPF